MCTMNFRAFLFTSMILLLAGCGQTFKLNLPDNHISFPADGGSVEYVYSNGFMLENIFIDGERQQTSPLYIGSKIVGECSEWINVIDGREMGNHGVYTIEVKANAEKKPRSAVLNVSNCNNYGEIYIYQEGRSE